MNSSDNKSATRLINGLPADAESCKKLISSYGERSAYEVIRIIEGKPLFAKEHINRLISSCISRPAPPPGYNEVCSGIEYLTELNDITNGNIRIDRLSDEQNYLLLYIIPSHYPTKDQYSEGVPATVHFLEREDPTSKTRQSELRKHVNAIIRKESVYEVLMVNKNGLITEGSRSNIFFIKDDSLITPPIGMILPGITRMKIKQLCSDHNIPLIEKEINHRTIGEYESAFLTGTSPKILPLNRAGNFRYNPSHQLMDRLIEWYDEMIKQDIHQNY